MNTRSRRCLEALWQEHWSAFPMERLYHFLHGSRSAASVVFIYLARHDGSLRTSAFLRSPHLQLVHRWLRRPALICPACLFNIILTSVRGRVSDIVMREDHRFKRSKKTFGRHYPPRLNPAPGAWDRLFGFCWSIDDDTVPGLHLRLPHLICAASMLGRDKQQQDAPVFPSPSALISKDWVLASRCYNRNNLCSTWDRYLAAGLFSRLCVIKPLSLHKKLPLQLKVENVTVPSKYDVEVLKKGGCCNFFRMLV